MQLPLIINLLRPDVWSALPKFHTSQGLLLIFKSNSTKIQGHFEVSLEFKIGAGTLSLNKLCKWLLRHKFKVASQICVKSAKVSYLQHLSDGNGLDILNEDNILHWPLLFVLLLQITACRGWLPLPLYKPTCLHHYHSPQPTTEIIIWSPESSDEQQYNVF